MAPPSETTDDDWSKAMADAKADDAGAAKPAAPAGGAEADAMAAEWEAMLGGDEEAAGGAGAAKESTRVLNQDEIDSLLGFDEASDDGEQKSGIQAILNSALVSYERLPMLEVVFDRLVRMMTTSLRNFTSDNVEV